MASGLNSLLGFNKNTPSNIGNTSSNRSVGAGNRDDLAQAMELLRIQRSIQNMLKGFSPQARIIGIFAITFIIGLPINALLDDPKVSIGFFLFFAGMVLLLSWGLMENRQVKFGMLLGWFVATGIWVYIFYRRILQMRIEESVGKGAFICNPFGVCKDDGWTGSLDGLKRYQYTDPTTNITTPYIPGNKLKIVKPMNFTLCFWLRVSYNDWRKQRFQASPSPVIVKGGTLENASPSIWLDEKTNVIQFQANPLMDPNPVIITLNYPFDQWVHYGVVFQQDSMEVYRNGLLEKTLVLPHPISLNKSNLYIGATPLSTNEGEMPAEMLYLMYYNRSLSSGDVDGLYKDQLTKMKKLPPPTKSLADSDPHCKECPQDCEKKTGETKKTKSVMDKVDSFLSSLGIDNDPHGSKPKKKFIDTKKISEKISSFLHFDDRTVESFEGSMNDPDTLCNSFSNIDHLYHPF